MNIAEQFFLAIKSYGLAFQNLDKYNIWRLMILPALLSLVIAVLVGVLAWITADDILILISEKLKINEPDQDYSRAIEFFIVFIIRGGTLFIYLKLYRYLVLILLSPIFVNIARVLHEKENSEQSQKLSIWQYCFCSFRGIRLGLRNLILELLVSVIAIFLAIIIVWLSPLLPFFMLLIESYFFSKTLIDYHYEMKGNSSSQSMALIKDKTSYIIGNGLIFNFILLVPVLGVIFAPIVAFIASYSGLKYLENQYDEANNLNKPIYQEDSAGV